VSAPGRGRGSMLALVDQLPDQLAGSVGLPGRADLRRPAAAPRNLILCGMGGSAIAGDLVAPLVAAAGGRLHVHRDYGLPPWADAETWVIASSYSGKTEETLDAVAAARERGCPLVGLTSGGTLAALGVEAGFPVVTLPPDLPPRASLCHGLGALCWVLYDLGRLPGAEAEIGEAVAVLREGVALHGDPASATALLAGRLAGRLTVIFTSSPESLPAGLRLKAQINENAKAPAYAIACPELDHNDIVGWELPPSARDRYGLVVLESDDAHPRNRLRMDITLDLLGGELPLQHRERARGARPLARILSLVQFGDYLSCHLARARGVDPVPVTRIDALKIRLSDVPTKGSRT
jgi:glucose/mannose-6-phosphate isomerase